MQHRIAPDVPVAIIQKFDSYDWKNVVPQTTLVMMQYLEKVIAYLPPKPPTWSFQGQVPTFRLSKNCMIPQAVFDMLNTRNWSSMNAEMIAFILKEADEYFAKMGVPKRLQTA
jgi:hypothetical protein